MPCQVVRPPAFLRPTAPAQQWNQSPPPAKSCAGLGGHRTNVATALKTLLPGGDRGNHCSLGLLTDGPSGRLAFPHPPKVKWLVSHFGQGEPAQKKASGERKRVCPAGVRTGVWENSRCADP